MTQEQQKGNSLIHNFMGIEHSKGVMGDSRIYYKIQVAYMDEKIMSAEDDFRYHISWDWLIPVIEKIGILHNYPTYLFFGKSRNSVTIHEIGQVIPVVRNDGENKYSKSIEIAYKTVVEFLEWYDNQIKEQ